MLSTFLVRPGQIIDSFTVATSHILYYIAIKSNWLQLLVLLSTEYKVAIFLLVATKVLRTHVQYALT